MRKIYSKKEPNILLHIICRMDEIINKKTENKLARIDVAPEEEFLQLAMLHMDKGRTFRPHRHIYKEGPDRVIAQESWVIFRGSVKIICYDIDDSIIHTDILKEGDCHMTFRGGHNFVAMEDDTIAYEYKTGPYMGIEMDKEMIE